MKKRVFLSVVVATSIGTAWLLAQPAGDSLIDGFKTVEVASVSDAIEQLYGQRAYMSHEMRPLAVTKFAGTAVTVQLKREEHKEGSAASQGMLDAIDAAPPGSVYVMVLDRGTGAPGQNQDGQGAAAGSWSNAGIDYAGIGGLMATAMKYRGFAGAVIDASVRDTPQIRKLQFPVFSRGVAPSTTINHFRVTGVNVPVTCAGVTVSPGDIITADEDGVAVVPKDRAAEILKKSQELDDTEHRMIPFIEKFKSIKEAVKQFGRI
jgi:4-hydroxy-4-methyl-2-oxoglutarate aldolase